MYPDWQVTPETLPNLYLRSPITGQQVLLSTVAKVTTTVRPLPVSHQGRFLAVTLSFNLAPGVALGQAIAAIDNLERTLGKADQQNDADHADHPEGGPVLPPSHREGSRFPHGPRYRCSGATLPTGSSMAAALLPATRGA